MAQTIRLKRSSVPGRVPTTSSLQTGEIAINTADGLVYIRKDDDSIIPLLGANTTVTGSIILSGSVTADNFIGDIQGTFSGSLQEILFGGPGLDYFDYDASSTVQVSLATGSNHFVDGVRKTISVTDTGGASGINLSYDNSTGVLSGTLQTTTFDLGNTTIELGDTVSVVDGLKLTDVSATGSFQGNLTGQADTALHANTATSASHAVTADFALNVSINSGSFLESATVSGDTLTFSQVDGTTFDRTINNVVSSSYATTSSYSGFAQVAAFAANVDTGSLISNVTVSGDTLTFIEGDGTSFDRTINNVANASQATTATSASHALVADFALNVDVESGSFLDNVTVSNDTLTFEKVDGTTFDRTINNVANADQATSASHALNADQAITASYANTATSASHATTADFALNVDTGSLLANATVSGDTLTFIKGDGTTFDRTVDNVSSASHATNADDAISSSYANTATSASHALIADFATNTNTGSFVKTATVSDATLTFTKGDGTSFNRTINNVVNADTASYALDAITSSFAQDAISASYAATASSADEFLVRGDLTVKGIVTAQEFHTEFVSASIVYSSGSTQFGDTSDDVHTFSGSVNVSGDVTATDVNIDDWGSVSASLASLENSAAVVPTLQSVTTQGNSTSQSIDLFVGNNDIFTQPQLHFRSGSDFYSYGRHSIQFDDHTLIAAQTNQGNRPATLFLGAITASFGPSPEPDYVPEYTAADVQIFGSDFRNGTEVAYPALTVRNPKGQEVSLEIRARESGSGGTFDNAQLRFSHPGMTGTYGGWALQSVGGGAFFHLQKAGLNQKPFLKARDLSGQKQLWLNQGANYATMYLEGDGNNSPAIYTSGSFFMQTNTEQSGTLEKILVQDQESSEIRWISPSNLANELVPTSTLDTVTDNGNTTTNSITVGGLTTTGTVSAGAFDGGTLYGTTLQLSSVSNAGVDTDKFLVLDASGNVDYRTGAEVLSDIGAGASTVDLQEVTDNGSTTTNTITSSDIVIDDWGSVSASLANATAAASGSNLQQVTNNGNFTTNSISASFFRGARFEIDNSDPKVGTIFGYNAVPNYFATQTTIGNTVIGYEAARDAVRLGNSTIIGDSAGRDLVPDLRHSLNVIIGSWAARRGGYVVASTIVGDQALQDISSSYNTIAIGHSVMEGGDAGNSYTDHSIAIGTRAGRLSPNTSGSIYIGTDSGERFTGSYASDHVTAMGIYIGTETKAQTGNTTNEIVIGAHTVGHGTNTVTIGSSEITNNYFTGNISGSDVEIDDWGSVSASLASLGGNVSGSSDLQGVTNNGNVTTNAITASAFNITGITNAGEDTDKFLVIDASGNVEFRTGNEMLEDLSIATESFDGNRGITNPLIPNLVDYNPGTDSVIDFLEQVFYPTVGEAFNILGNTPFRINESARSGSAVYTNALGYGGTTAKTSADTAVNTWALQTSALFVIDQSGNLSIKADLSGSATYSAPSTVPVTVIATDAFNTQQSRTFDVEIVADPIPTIGTNNLTFTHVVEHKTVPAAGSGSLSTTVSITDTESNNWMGAPEITVLTGSDSGNFSLEQTSATSLSRTYTLHYTEPLNSGSYNLEVTGSDDFGQIVSSSFTVTIQENLPPSVNQIPTSVALTIGASGTNDGETIARVEGVDPLSIDNVDIVGLTGTDASKFTTVLEGSVGTATTYKINATEDLDPAVFDLTASFSDDFGHVVSLPLDITVEAGAPTLPQPNGTFYIIESALNGDDVTTATSGIAGDIGNMSTNQSVTWSISPNTVLDIDSSGNLSVVTDISGSATYVVGYPIQATVTATNAYNQATSNNITVTVTDNVPATITPNLSGSIPNIQTLTTGKYIGSIVASDPQSYENVEITEVNGADASLFDISVESAAQTVTYDITANQALQSGSYVFDVTASDAYNQVTFGGPYTIVVEPNTPPTIGYIPLANTTLAGSTFSVDIDDATSGSDIGYVQTSTPVTEDDELNPIILVGAGASNFNLVLNYENQQQGSGLSATKVTRYTLQPTTDLSDGTSTFDVSGSDTFGFQVSQSLSVQVKANAPIADTNGTFHIIESALTGDSVTTAANGVAGTVATISNQLSGQTTTFSLQSGVYLAIDENNGTLSLSADLSGSAVKQAGDVITDTVTLTNQYGLTGTLTFQVNVEENVGPSINVSGLTTSFNENTSAAPRAIGDVIVTDPQSVENVRIISLTGTDSSKFSLSTETPAQSVTYALSSSQALPNGTYEFTLTAEDDYDNQATQDVTITVAENTAPTIALTGFSKLNTDAEAGEEVGTVLITDDEDGIASFTLSGTDAALFNKTQTGSTSRSKTFSITAVSDLDPANYNLTGSATDDFGLTTVKPIPVAIFTEAPDTPLPDGDLYIIESAVSGARVTNNDTGIWDGTPSDTGSLSTDQEVTWSIAPGTYLYITPGPSQMGSLSLKADVSGSTKVAGNIISATVTATNEFGDTSQRVIDVKVRPNEAPELSYTGLTVASGSTSAAGETVGTVTATDPQSIDSITGISLGGTDGSKFTLVQTGVTSYTRTYNINVGGTGLDVGNYSVDFTATDSFGKQTTETKTISVTDVATTPVYIYTNNSFASKLNTDKSEASALLYGLGYKSSNQTYIANLLLDKFIDGDIGSSTVNINFGPGYTATLRQSGNLDSLLDVKSLGSVNSNFGVGEQVVILFPSSSAALSSLPVEMFTGAFIGEPGEAFDPTGGTGKHGLVSYETAAAPFAIQAGIHYFTVTTPVNGYSDWGVVFTYDAPTANTQYTVPAYGEILP